MHNNAHNNDLFAISKFRLLQAKEMLKDAELAFNHERYKTCNNRAYFAIFHAMRAVHALTGYDSSSHSAIISEFLTTYIKTGVFDRRYSVIIKRASEIKNDSDYEDFYITSRTEAEGQAKNAKLFIDAVSEYLERIPKR